MRLILIIGYFFSFYTYGWDSFNEFGNFSNQLLRDVPFYLKASKEVESKLLYRTQIRELEFDDIDFSTTKWRKKRLQKLLNSGRLFDSYDEKNTIIIGQVAVVRGEAFILRGKGQFKVKKKSTFKPGDLIETKESGHLWLSLIDGTMIRLAPNSTYSLEFFEKSEKKVILYHRINNGNVHFISRLQKSVTPSSTIETDRIFYPFFDVHEYSRLFSFSKERKFDSKKMHKEKFNFLNFLIKVNEGFNRDIEVEHIINTPFLIFDALAINVEFLINWQGFDFVKFHEMDSKLKVFKKNISKLQDVAISKKKVWYEASMNKIEVSERSDLAWYGQFVTSDIPSIRIIAELFIQDQGESFFSKSNNKKLWRKYELSEKKLALRKEFLIDYFNKQGASFLNERAEFVTRERYDNREILENYLFDYYQYSRYFNRLFSELNLEIDLSDSKSLLKKIIKFNNKIDYLFRDFKGSI